jgi:8-oxo-dGTP diphosphatase
MTFLTQIKVTFNNQKITSKLFKLEDGKMPDEKIYRVYALIKNNEDKYCIVYNKKHDKWGLPGGHLEDGETLLQALSRELKEEVGIEIEQANPRFAVYHMLENNKQEMEIIVTAQQKSLVPKTEIEDETISHFESVSFEEIPKKLKPAEFWETVVENL